MQAIATVVDKPMCCHVQIARSYVQTAVFLEMISGWLSCQGAWYIVDVDVYCNGIADGSMDNTHITHAVDKAMETCSAQGCRFYTGSVSATCVNGNHKCQHAPPAPPWYCASSKSSICILTGFWCLSCHITTTTLNIMPLQFADCHLLLFVVSTTAVQTGFCARVITRISRS